MNGAGGGRHPHTAGAGRGSSWSRSPTKGLASGCARRTPCPVGSASRPGPRGCKPCEAGAWLAPRPSVTRSRAQWRVERSSRGRGPWKEGWALDGPAGRRLVTHDLNEATETRESARRASRARPSSRARRSLTARRGGGRARRSLRAGPCGVTAWARRRVAGEGRAGAWGAGTRRLPSRRRRQTGALGTMVFPRPARN